MLSCCCVEKSQTFSCENLKIWSWDFDKVLNFKCRTVIYFWWVLIFASNFFLEAQCQRPQTTKNGSWQNKNNNNSSAAKKFVFNKRHVTSLADYFLKWVTRSAWCLTKSKRCLLLIKLVFVFLYFFHAQWKANKLLFAETKLLKILWETFQCEKIKSVRSKVTYRESHLYIVQKFWS